MHRTPHGLIAFGVLLLVLAYTSLVRGVVYSAIDGAVVYSARLASERMTVEELQRVFDMPARAEARVWMENRMGRMWTRGLQSGSMMSVASRLGGSAVFFAWGWAEFRARRTATASTP